MQKSAPSPVRIFTMVVFALSCFGLLLFLWLSFGGPIPLKPKGYRVQVAFPEAPTLGLEADVRVAGVSVGKVRTKELDDGNNRTLVSLELERKFSPLAVDARAILRQKTLLGETYVELTPGTSRRKVPEGGRLPEGQVQDAVELDEIFQALDPQTRGSFRRWQQDLGEGISGRGRDFNDALGTLPGFAHDGADVLDVLDSQEGAVSRLVKNTGVVFGALTENETQLRNLITGSGRLFKATQSRNDALAESIRIFPTFLDESKSTLARLRGFSRDTRPLIRDLRPVARDLEPTLADVRALGPDLRSFFRNLDPLISVSRTGLPALRDVLRETKPLLGELNPFLSQLNPVLQFLEAYQFNVADFIANGPAALADTTTSDGGVGHYLRQIGPTGSESAAIFNERLPSNRGNSYFIPLAHFSSPKAAKHKISPQWDCIPSGGEKEPEGSNMGCFVQDKLGFQGLSERFPRPQPADYGGK